MNVSLILVDTGSTFSTLNTRNVHASKYKKLYNFLRPYPPFKKLKTTIT